MPDPGAVIRALLRILRATARLEARAARAQRRVLMATRRDLRQLLAAQEPGSFRQGQLSGLLAAVDRELLRGRAAALGRAGLDAREALDLGRRGADAALGARLAGDLAFVDVSPALVGAVVDVTTDQIRAVWTELGSTLKATIRRATLGVIDGGAAQAAVVGALRDAKTFGTAATRAEVIVRTEINRTYELAGDERLAEADARTGGTVRKFWLPTLDDRTRESHLEAGRQHGVGGTPGPIRPAESFLVGGARLRFPVDPAGPPAEVINCRCRSVPLVEDGAGAAPLLESFHRALRELAGAV